MFSNAQSLPPLSALTPDHRAVRLTAPQTQPLPTGGCRFILLHPSIANQRCTCQSFHHSGKPGSTCACGHQACYHVHTSPPSTGNSSPIVSWAVPPTAMPDPPVNALLDKINRLEQALEDEKQARREELKQEQRLRERDVRMLREALQPFYRSESGVKKKLIELEDRIEGNYDEQVQMKERLIEVDDAAMMLEKRLDEVEGPRIKRRRFGRKQAPVLRKGSALSESSVPGLSPTESSHGFHSRTAESEYSPLSPPKSNSTPQESAEPSPRHRHSPQPTQDQSPRQTKAYDYASVFYNNNALKPNVDSATITQGMLATSMPLFHSSLAPGSDPEDGRSDEEDGDASPEADEDLEGPDECSLFANDAVANDLSFDLRPRDEVSVRNAGCRHPG